MAVETTYIALDKSSAQASIGAAFRQTLLEKTLEWYAERRNHTPPAGTPSMPPSSGGWLGTNDSFDGNGPGARARAALALFDRKEQTP